MIQTVTFTEDSCRYINSIFSRLGEAYSMAEGKRIKLRFVQVGLNQIIRISSGRREFDWYCDFTSISSSWDVIEEARRAVKSFLNRKTWKESA